MAYVKITLRKCIDRRRKDSEPEHFQPRPERISDGYGTITGRYVNEVPFVEVKRARSYYQIRGKRADVLIVDDILSLPTTKAESPREMRETDHRLLVLSPDMRKWQEEVWRRITAKTMRDREVPPWADYELRKWARF